MRTQIYDHRSGLKVVPHDIVDDVEKIIWDISPTLSRRTVKRLKESIRERLEKKGWTGEYRLDTSSKITISSYLRGIGLCFQTGNVGRIYADLLKFRPFIPREIFQLALSSSHRLKQQRNWVPIWQIMSVSLGNCLFLVR